MDSSPFALEEEQRYKESHVILEKALIRGKYIQISLLSLLVNILRIDKYFKYISTITDMPDFYNFAEKDGFLEDAFPA